MMALIGKLIDILQQKWLIHLLAVVLIIWLSLHLFCWLCGALAMAPRMKKKGLKPRIAAFLPGWQSWSELQLLHRERQSKAMAALVWWGNALAMAGAAATIWAAVCYLHELVFGVFILLILALFLWIAALVIYIRYRAIEYDGLKEFFPQRPMRMITLLGMVLAIPLHRILLMLGYAK